MSNRNDGFVDLRVHRALDGSHSDESIWPSFTDIMMVVVMIFLISSVVFMLRNVELSREISSAEISEEEALDAAESIRQKSLYLAEIIEETRKKLAVAEERNDELRNLNIQREARIQDLEYETIGLYEAHALLLDEIKTLNQGLDEIRGERLELTSRIESMNTTVADLEQLIVNKNSELVQLQENYKQKLLEIAAIEQTLEKKINELNSLQTSFENLQEVEDQQKVEIAELKSQQELSEQQTFDLEAKARKQAEQIEELRLSQTIEQTKNEQLAALVQDRDAEIQRLLQSELFVSAQLEGQKQVAYLLDQEKKKAELEIERVRLNLETLEQQLFELSKKSSVLSTTDEQQKLTIKLQEQEQAQLREELAVRLEQLFASKEQQIETELKLQQLTTMVANLEQNLVESQETSSHQVATIESQRAVIVELRAEMAEKLQELSSNLAVQESKLESAQESELRQQDIIDEQSQELANLRALEIKFNQEIQDKELQLSEASGRNVQIQQVVTETKSELEQLRKAYQERIAELAELQELYADQSEDQKSLREQIVVLEDEKQMMFKPARSPANRYVVEITYHKDASGNAIYQYKLPQQDKAVQVDFARLNEVLTDLISERPEGLYTKIIFPNQGNLSYNEAWEFTQKIQHKYDYYFQ